MVIKKTNGARNEKVKSRPKKKLTKKQLRFIQEYPIDFNGTQAAIKAGYSKNRADQTAYRLLRKVEIQEAIQKRIKKISDKLDLTQERIIQEYARIAFFDIRKLYDENGGLKKITDLDDDTAAAVASISITEIGDDEDVVSFLKKIRTIDKKGALDSAARILNLFEKDNNRNLNLTFEDFVDELNED